MKYISLLVLSLFLFACGNTKESTAMHQQKSLTEHYKISGMGNNNTLSEDLTLTFNLKTKIVSGFSGCNQFSGTFLVDGESITFGPLASTRKMCQPDTNTTEQHLLKALQETVRFSISNKTVSLYNSEGSAILILEETRTSETKMTDNTSTVTYSAVSRGYFMIISYENNRIIFQNDRNSKPIVKMLTNLENASLSKKIADLDLNTLETLSPPSTAHQYDGAPGATLKISQVGDTYTTSTFDHGNPPAAIKALVSELLAHTEN